MVEWLKRMVMVQKVAGRSFEAGLRNPTTGRFLCQTSSKWVPFSNQGKICQQKEGDRLRLSFSVPKNSWNLPHPHCSYDY